jgi:L-lactate dehydrogenase complex protein LldF
MTTSPFRTKIREKIADEALQAALDANAKRRVQGRINAFASLPDWQERRQRAHAVRAEVIGHLDEYIDKFIATVNENGITVHRAKDAVEAIKIFLDIVGANASFGDADASRSPLLVAKSKSMVTEEIGLNHALEEAGHQVVETDLGEYIIQLRGERPSHIITPAVHMRRHEVGELFADKLGIPYTEDIPTLTDTARKELREVFLDADVGVSGVNFGVVETGTLTLVTNEGNGRMVATLPPVHIAVMGMERLVPTLDDLALMLSLLPRSATTQKICVYTQIDLALMLSLLPRSATTQKICVYTQLIHSPEKDQQKHLILVDNGRSRLRDSHLQEILYCIRCGSCLNACPVFRELGGHGYLGENGDIAPYPGPIGSVVSPGLFGENYFQLAQASSLCGACKDACPVDIDLPKLLTRVRAGAANEQFSVTSDQAAAGLSSTVIFGLRTYTRVAQIPGLYALSQRLAGLGARLVAPVSKWMKFPASTGWGYSKDFPRPSVKPFRERFNRDPHSGDLGAKNAKDIKIGELKVDKETKAPEASKINLVGRFTEELLALSGQVVICKEANLQNKVIALLREKTIDRVQAWNQIPGLDWDALTKAGISVQGEADETIKTGITGALAGISETGTLVIPGGAGRPLTASLLPEIHIAVLRASDILPSMEAAMSTLEIAKSPTVALVSGPSRTADIEMTLTIGVHGPGELHVFVMQ